jgi:hypothetical protein
VHVFDKGSVYNYGVLSSSPPATTASWANAFVPAHHINPRALKYALERPLVEVVVDGFVRTFSNSKRGPLTPGAQCVDDAVQQVIQAEYARSTHPSRWTSGCWRGRAGRLFDIADVAETNRAEDGIGWCHRGRVAKKVVYVEWI